MRSLDLPPVGLAIGFEGAAACPEVGDGGGCDLVADPGLVQEDCVADAARVVFDMLISTAEENMRQAEEHLRVTRNKYEASMISMADLLDAQSQWQAAASNLIEAQTQYLIYRTQYLKAVGQLSD